MWSCWRAGGLTCLPRVNLVSNIGFGPGATHTVDAGSEVANLPTERMRFPLTHPQAVVSHQAFDGALTRHLGFAAKPPLQRLARNLLKPIRSLGKRLAILRRIKVQMR